jgi:hypothetical protein
VGNGVATVNCGDLKIAESARITDVMSGFHQRGHGFYQRRKFKSEVFSAFVLPAKAGFQGEMIFLGRSAWETCSSDYVSWAFRPFLCPLPNYDYDTSQLPGNFALKLPIPV